MRQFLRWLVFVALFCSALYLLVPPLVDARGGYLHMEAARTITEDRIDPETDSIEYCYRRHKRRVACVVRWHGALEVVNEETGEVSKEDMFYTVRVWLRGGRIFTESPLDG